VRLCNIPDLHRATGRAVVGELLKAACAQHINLVAAVGSNLARPGYRPLSQVGAVAGELLDSTVARIGHVDVVVRVHRQGWGRVELTRVGPGHAPLGQIAAGLVQLHDAVVASIGHIHVVLAVRCNALGTLEPARDCG